MPRWRGSAVGSVSARRANVLPSRPLVTNIFVPEMTYSLPDWRATVRMACTSEPACGSVRHRSEEHTSELQSRGHLVCRPLLEKLNFALAQEERQRKQR